MSCRGSRVRKRRKQDWWTRLRRITGVVLLAVLVAGIVWWVHRPLVELSHLHIRNIQVRGNHHVTKEDIRSQAGIHTPVNAFQLDLEEMAGRIMAHPWIRSVSIERRLPSGLIITVEERQAIGLLTSGKTYLLSTDGLILEEMKKSSTRVLPRFRPAWRVRYRVGEHLDDPHLLEGLELLGALPDVPVLRQAELEEITVEADGYYVLHLAQGRPVLRLGPIEPLRQLTRLEIALRHRGLKLENFAYVDLRFPGRVILKPWRKEAEQWDGRTT